MRGFAAVNACTTARVTTPVGEARRSFSARALTADLQRLVPALTISDLEPGGAGVRAQAVDTDGKLVDDFRLEGDGHVLHVLNAPSPAATASLRIGRELADTAAAAG